MAKTRSTTARVGLTSFSLEIIKDASPEFDMDYYNIDSNICFASSNSVFASSNSCGDLAGKASVTPLSNTSVNIVEN